MVRDPSLRHRPSLEAEAGTDIVSVATLAQARGVRTSRGIRHRRKVAGLLARVLLLSLVVGYSSFTAPLNGFFVLRFRDSEPLSPAGVCFKIPRNSDARKRISARATARIRARGCRGGDTVRLSLKRVGLYPGFSSF
jgi:hypothetical protein